MWIKICGNTNLADAQLAVEAGADAVGFVFAPSPRRVHAAQVAAITPYLPAALEKYGVFVDSTFDEIVAAVCEAGLSGVQLHASQDATLPDRLRDHFGASLRILQVAHYAQNLEEQLQAFHGNKVIDAVLVDSRTATAVGGTGIAFDWLAARRSFTESGMKLIAAGGLKPENVAEAIRILQPWGVDVASGVEAAPGRKDPARVKAFVAAAKAAAEAIAATAR